MAGLLSRASQWVFGPNPAMEPDDDFLESLNEDELSGDVTNAIDYDRVEEPASQRASAAEAAAPAPAASNVTSLDARRQRPSARTLSGDEIVHLQPMSWSDAMSIAEIYRESKPVILNLTRTDEVQGQRLLDFCAGMAHITSGSMEKITGRVYLVSPARFKVTAKRLDKMESAEAASIANVA